MRRVCCTFEDVLGEGKSSQELVPCVGGCEWGKEVKDIERQEGG